MLLEVRTRLSEWRGKGQSVTGRGQEGASHMLVVFYPSRCRWRLPWMS